MVSLPSRNLPLFSCIIPSKGKYCRAEQLPPLLKLWPQQLEDYSYPGTLKIAALLRKALRVERNRARAGHWAYNLNRHMSLMDALQHERARLAALASALPSRCAVSHGGAERARPQGTLRLPHPVSGPDPTVNFGFSYPAHLDPDHRPH